jgi:hypothetical protein
MPTSTYEIVAPGEANEAGNPSRTTAATVFDSLPAPDGDGENTEDVEPTLVSVRDVATSLASRSSSTFSASSDPLVKPTEPERQLQTNSVRLHAFQRTMRVRRFRKFQLKYLASD